MHEFIARCVYCKSDAPELPVALDAMGLPACRDHSEEANDYFEQLTGRNSNEDTFLYCDDHCDFWQPNCARCEECSQHHYGMTVKEFKKTPMSEIRVYPLDIDTLATGVLEKKEDG